MSVWRNISWVLVNKLVLVRNNNDGNQNNHNGNDSSTDRGANNDHDNYDNDSDNNYDNSNNDNEPPKSRRLTARKKTQLVSVNLQPILEIYQKSPPSVQMNSPRADKRQTTGFWRQRWIKGAKWRATYAENCSRAHFCQTSGGKICLNLSRKRGTCLHAMRLWAFGLSTDVENVDLAGFDNINFCESLFCMQFLFVEWVCLPGWYWGLLLRKITCSGIN